MRSCNHLHDIDQARSSYIITCHNHLSKTVRNVEEWKHRCREIATRGQTQSKKREPHTHISTCECSHVTKPYVSLNRREKR